MISRQLFTYGSFQTRSQLYTLLLISIPIRVELISRSIFFIRRYDTPTEVSSICSFIIYLIEKFLFNGDTIAFMHTDTQIHTQTRTITVQDNYNDDTQNYFESQIEKISRARSRDSKLQRHVWPFSFNRYFSFFFLFILLVEQFKNSKEY